MTQPDPDKVDTGRYGPTSCDTCPMRNLQPARTLAQLVLLITSDTTPAGFTSDDERRAKELARQILSIS